MLECLLLRVHVGRVPLDGRQGRGLGLELLRLDLRRIKKANYTRGMICSCFLEKTSYNVDPPCRQIYQGRKHTHIRRISRPQRGEEERDREGHTQTAKNSDYFLFGRRLCSFTGSQQLITREGDRSINLSTICEGSRDGRSIKTLRAGRGVTSKKRPTQNSFPNCRRNKTTPFFSRTFAVSGYDSTSLSLKPILLDLDNESAAASRPPRW